MAYGPQYRVQFRRRREGKTNYYRRRQMILSQNPRVIVRTSLNHITIQIADIKSEGDKILVSAHSTELRGLGWNFHTGNMPSSYLTGFLAGSRAVDKKIAEVIVDFGIQPKIPKARLYAALKGLLDAGISINCDEEMLPDDEQVQGKPIAAFAEQLKAEDEQKYQKQFSATIGRKADPTRIPEVFEKVKAAISKNSGAPKKIAAKPPASPKAKTAKAEKTTKTTKTVKPKAEKPAETEKKTPSKRKKTESS